MPAPNGNSDGNLGQIILDQSQTTGVQTISFDYMGTGDIKVAVRGVNDLNDLGTQVGNSWHTTVGDPVTHADFQATDLLGWTEVTQPVNEWTTFSFDADFGSGYPYIYLAFHGDTANIDNAFIPNPAYVESAIPEPSTFVLLGLASLVLLGRVVRGWRRR